MPSLVLGAGALLVVLGGLYLWHQVGTSGASAPSSKSIEEARRRSETGGTGSPTRPETPRRPPLGAGTVTGGGDDDGSGQDGPHLPQRPRIARGLQDVMPGSTTTIGDDPPEKLDDAELDSRMLEANKAYDRHDYDGARAQAEKLLASAPGNVRMLRVVVSSSCIMGDADEAQKYWNQLPQFDRNQMAERCSRFGVVFDAPSAAKVP